MRVLERLPTVLKVEVDGDLFPEEVVFKCFYWYTGTYNIDIDRGSQSTLIVCISPRSGSFSAEDFPSLEQRIRQDLVDHRTRDIVSKETRTIRELLIAKAFAPIDNTDVDPPGSVSDPVGFSPADFDVEP